MRQTYQIILAGIPLNLQLRKSLVIEDLARWLIKDNHPMYYKNVPDEDVISAFSAEEMRDGRSLFEHKYRSNGIELTEEALEFELLVYRLSDALFKHEAFVFHGVSFLWRNRAYLFAGPSGIGKTTQYRRWKDLLGDDIHIMNGDKPILRFWKNEASVTVHPSPWHGSERYGSGLTAPLGGIVLLEQSEENSFQIVPPQLAGIPLFLQLMSSMNDEKTIRLGAGLISRLGQSVPVWKLKNRGDIASAKLACQSILENERNFERDGRA